MYIGKHQKFLSTKIIKLPFGYRLVFFSNMYERRWHFEGVQREVKEK